MLGLTELDAITRLVLSCDFYLEYCSMCHANNSAITCIYHVLHLLVVAAICTRVLMKVVFLSYYVLIAFVLTVLIVGLVLFLYVDISL